MTLLSGYKAASGDKPPIAVLAALRHPKQAQCRVSQPGRDFAHIRNCQPPRPLRTLSGVCGQRLSHGKDSDDRCRFDDFELRLELQVRA
jgi:hypothetical protein